MYRNLINTFVAKICPPIYLPELDRAIRAGAIVNFIVYTNVNLYASSKKNKTPATLPDIFASCLKVRKEVEALYFIILYFFFDALETVTQMKVSFLISPSKESFL